MDKEEFLWRLNNKLPGQKVKDSKLEPPNTSIYFSKISKKFFVRISSIFFKSKIV